MSLLQNRSKYQHRTQGKTCKCPAGHSLQPLKASAGSCDGYGCKARVADGEYVMGCLRCNHYLCQQCHPQSRKEPQSWLWGSVSSLADKLSQEFTDLKEVAEIAETKGPLAACAAPPVGRDDTEITVPQKVAQEEEEKEKGEESGDRQAIVAAPVTPAGTVPHAAEVAQVERLTPPKVEAPKEAPVIDLLDLDFEPKVETSARVDTANAGLPLDLL